jgi:hypothetical protein
VREDHDAREDYSGNDILRGLRTFARFAVKAVAVVAVQDIIHASNRP